MSDIEALRRLISDYNMNGDRGRMAAMGALFGEDGVLEAQRFRLTGAKEISEKLGGTVSSTAKPPLFMRHNLTTSQFDFVDAENATGRHYFMVVTEIGLDHMGVYVDKYRKRDGAWRFAHRRVQMDYFAPDSGFGGPGSVPERRRARA